MATPSISEPGIAAQAHPGVLVSEQLAAAGEQVVYTCPPNCAARVSFASLANISGAVVTCGFGVARSGAGLDNTHKVLPETTSIAAGAAEPINVGEGIWLGDGDSITANPGTAAAIDVVLSGVVYS